jgi:hypothetical protein
MQRGIGQNRRTGWYVQFLAYPTRFLTSFCSTTVVDSCRRCFRYPHHSRHPCSYSLSAASLVFHLIEQTGLCGCYTRDTLILSTTLFSYRSLRFSPHGSITFTRSIGSLGHSSISYLPFRIPPIPYPTFPGVHF